MKVVCDMGIFRKEDPEDARTAFYFHAHVGGSNGPNDSGAPGKSEKLTQLTPYNFCMASSLCGRKPKSPANINT